MILDQFPYEQPMPDVLIKHVMKTFN